MNNMIEYGMDFPPRRSMVVARKHTSSVNTIVIKTKIYKQHKF